MGRIWAFFQPDPKAAGLKWRGRGINRKKWGKAMEGIGGEGEKMQ